MLLTNGRVYTLDARSAVVDSLVVREGRIAFAGRRADVNLLAAEPVVDLGGRAVLPGLVDAHAHLQIMARARLTVSLGQSRSEDEAAARVAGAAAAVAPGEWLGGRGWDQTLWPGGAFPTRASLDRVAPANPVALVRVDGHATWVNSAALRLTGIDRHTGDPAGGRVVKDERGEPTGLLIDAAQELVRRAEPAPSDARLDQALRDAMAECLGKGLTGIHEMGADLAGLAAYRRLLERGHFPIRSYVAVSGRKAWGECREHGRETLGDARLVVGAIKLWLDGALGSRGAALHDPYCDDPGNTGLLLMEPEELEATAGEASDHGFQVCVHAIGDRANTLALDVFERLGRKRGGGPRLRYRMEHAQILAERDIPRFRALGVLPSMQPIHCISDMRWAVERLGPERLSGAYAWRSLLRTGSIIASGSDFPVEDPNPFHGIYAAVTRRALDGERRGWQPEQRMTREEAVRSFTLWNAYAAGQEEELGSLEPGKRADLVALSDDVFRCPESRIGDIVPVLTMVGGQVAFTRGGEGGIEAWRA